MPSKEPTPIRVVGRRLEQLNADLDAVARDVDALTRGAWRLEPGGTQLLREAPLAFKRIVLAVDDTPASRLAAAWAQRVAKVFGAQVWVISVVPPAMVLEYYASAMQPGLMLNASALFREEEAAAEQRVSAMASDLRRDGIEAHGVPVSGAAVSEIVALAEREHADLVVLGAHDDDVLTRALLGSVAEGVKNHTKASVLIARGLPEPRRLLVPVDGSRASKRAAALALRLSRAWDAPASFLHAVEPVAAIPEHALESAYKAVLGGIDLGWTQPRASAAVEIGKPAEVILRAAAEEQPGLIVMGSRGLSGVRSLVAGSVSNRVAHGAKTSVLLVKEPAS